MGSQSVARRPSLIIAPPLGKICEQPHTAFIICGLSLSMVEYSLVPSNLYGAIDLILRGGMPYQTRRGA
jgi:hypothetical protein